MVVQHPFYMVDSSLLPPAGVKRTLDGPPSASLAARQERLQRWHVDQQQKGLAKLGLAAVGGHGTSTDVYPVAAGATARQSGLRRKDPRLRGTPSSLSPPGLDSLIDVLRRRLQHQGMTANVILRRMFEETDINKSGCLSTEQFREVLMRLDLLQNDGECDLIFAYFDEDRSGSIDFNEFLDALKGQLNDVRRAVVREAFRSLDTDGDGALSLQDLLQKFKNTTHPDVRNHRSEDKVYSEFLSCFDVISKDGKVTLAELERYYEYLSAMTPNDEFFVAMVRNAWHLPGALGGPCLRVSIKRLEDVAVRDQRLWRGPSDPKQRGYSSGIGHVPQEIIEIRPDLSVSRHDPKFLSAVRERLEEMGYHDIADVEVIGS
uniref:EF-hand domain-containing protein n=2 Tax=Alexandrium monilatum TaxID=311494 RepID=A0A7S4QVS0_9DINO